jgi:TolB protein
MNADGSEQWRLTDDPGVDLRPSRSPDGARLAFASNRSGNREIYFMDPDGSNVEKLTDHISEDGDPSWSPEGKQLLFYSDREGSRDIYVMTENGTEVKRLTRGTPTSSLPPGHPMAPESRIRRAAETFSWSS